MNQNSDSMFLSAAALKARARDALRGNYGKAVLATLSAMAITLACQFLIGMAEAVVFSFYIVFKELQNGLTLNEVSLLVSNLSYMDGYMETYNAINYVLSGVLSVFTSVLDVGLYFFCLNLACGRTIRVSDIFHGFRHDFGKAIQLTAVAVLVSQLYSLPLNVLNYLAERQSWQMIPPALAVLALGTSLSVLLNLGLSQIFLLLLDFPTLSAGEIIKQSFRIMKGHKSRLFYIQLSFLPLMILSFLSFGIGNIFLAPYMNVTHAFFFLNLMRAGETTPTY